MITDKQAIQLHDRATRGQQLSSEEQSTLVDWYKLQDEREGAVLATDTREAPIASLRSDIAAATARLRTSADRIDALLAQTDALRREIAALQRQLPPFSLTPT